ncbi:MAG: hypothetical protein LBF83_02770 [Spirochaetaceae bacterium]|nr:hypothetical protein [Spirochaetaceae bacterium]
MARRGFIREARRNLLWQAVIASDAKQSTVRAASHGSLRACHNIIECKSLWKNISIFDFNKVCGYAYIYSALRKAPLDDITVTFIADPYPRSLFAYLRRLGYAVKEIWAVFLQGIR